MSSPWKNWMRGFAVLLLLLVTARGTFAQNPTFNVEGVVTDAQQAVLPGATVTIRTSPPGSTRTATTDSGGRYVVSGLPPEGRYQVQVELPGFAIQVREEPRSSTPASAR